MANGDDDVRIDITADVSGLKAGVNDAKSSLESLARTFKQPAAAMDAAANKNDAFVASLRRQVDTFGMTRGQIVSYDAQIKGLTGAHLDSANALGKQLDALEANEKMMGRMKIAAAAMAAAATAAIVVLIKQSADLAARYETMGVVMGVAGNNAGYTRAEMFALEKQMQATGISMIKSREALTSMATANIDLAKATGMARAAQDLAVVANINSSDALVRMVQGIKSGEAEILKTMGLNVSFEASYKDLAASLGINTSALSEQQKMMARTDAVMQESARYAGIYEESMTTAGKAINSLSRYWEDFKVKAGAVFLPTLTTSVFGLTDALKAANAELSKTGSVVTIDSIGRGLDAAFRTVFETVAVLGANAVFVLSAIGREIGGIAAQAAAVMHLDFSGARQIGKDMRADAEASRAALDAFEKRIMTRPTAAPDSASGAGEAARIAAGGRATVQGTSMDPASAKAASDAAKKIRDVIDSLKFEAAQLGRSAEAQELYNRLKQAGVSIGSQAGQQIKALTEDLTRQQAVLSALDREFDEAVKGQEAMTQAFDAARMAERIEAEKMLADQVDRLNASLNAKADAESDAMTAANALIKGYTDETAVLGLSNEARALAISMRELEAKGINLSADALEDYRKRLTEAVQANQFAKAAKDLDAYLNPAKAKSFGDALSNAFGKAGTAMGKMAGAFDNYAQAQAEFNEKMKALSPEDRIEREIELSKKQGEIQVNAYGDMAGAAKAFFDEGSTGYKVLSAAEQGFRAVQMALSIASMIQGAAETTTSVAQSGTKAAASTTAGVAKAFEQMGVWGFVGAAAIIAFMASMGVRGGSGSVSMSAMRQSEQGTGTVLGDPDAKSESLINALDMLADVNTLTMQYSARMAKSLQNIEIALTGVSSMIYRTPGLTSGNLSGIQEMSKTGTLGFSSKSVAVTDSGLTYQGLISGIAEGLQSFTEVTTKKSSWFGLNKSTRTDTVLTDADDDVSQQFQMIFNNISDSLIAAGGVLGNSADILETQIANIEIDLGMVSLKGLKGDELEEALNAVISASADNIARQALPGLDKYQQVGEGYFETAIRVAYSTEVVQASLAALDKGFTGAATDIVDFSQSLINAFGDLETMGDALAGYYDLFYSEEEKLAHTTASLVAGFARINLEVPETSAGFRALVDALDLTTAAGQDAFVAMMDMAPAFAEVAEAAIDTAEALNDAALDAADAAMSALSRAVGAERDTIIAAYEQQSAAIQASINSVSSSVANLTALSSALASTLIGMRPQEYAAQYRAQAQAQIGAALAIARAGGQLPTAESLKGALSTLTQDSRGQFATRTDYMRDQLRTAAELRELSDLADDALSIDERQLRAMQDQLDQLKLGYEGEMLRLDSILDSAQAQIDALHGIDTSVLSVEAAIVALGAAINAAKAPAAVAAVSGTASAGGSATHALTSTIAAYGAANGGDAYYFIEGINDLSAKMETKAMIAATLGITVEEAWARFDSKGLAYWEEVQRQWDAGLKPTTSSIPGFAVGTNYVPSDMVAQIHAGERIIPAADNTELMARLRDPQANNAALVAELKALREEVVLLRAETRATVSNTGKTAALLDRAMPDGDAMAMRAVA